MFLEYLLYTKLLLLVAMFKFAQDDQNVLLFGSRMFNLCCVISHKPMGEIEQ